MTSIFAEKRIKSVLSDRNQFVFCSDYTKQMQTVMDIEVTVANTMHFRLFIIQFIENLQ